MHYFSWAIIKFRFLSSTILSSPGGLRYILLAVGEVILRLRREIFSPAVLNPSVPFREAVTSLDFDSTACIVSNIGVSKVIAIINTTAISVYSPTLAVFCAPPSAPVPIVQLKYPIIRRSVVVIICSTIPEAALVFDQTQPIPHFWVSNILISQRPDHGAFGLRSCMCKFHESKKDKSGKNLQRFHFVWFDLRIIYLKDKASIARYLFLFHQLVTLACVTSNVIKM